MLTTFRKMRPIAFVAVGVMTLACSGDDPVKPPKVTPKLTFVSGGSGTDTINGKLRGIEVEVRDSSGALAKNVSLRFEALGSTGQSALGTLTVCRYSDTLCINGPITDLTGADGRGRAFVAFGNKVGIAQLRVTVSSLGATDSATYTVTPGNPARIVAFSRDTSLNIGTSAVLGARVFDRSNNPRTDAVTLSTTGSSVLSINAATNAVTAIDIGEYNVISAVGNLRDTTFVHAVPAARLVLWNSSLQTVLLVNSDGTDKRTLLTNVFSNFGAYPHFESRRQVMAFGVNVSTGNFTLIDTTGTPRRDVLASRTGILGIQALRLLADGSILIVGSEGQNNYSLFRIALDNVLTKLFALPSLSSNASGHADFSPDGTKLLYQGNNAVTRVGELRLMNVATGAESVFAIGADAPRWSPQGDRVIFVEGANRTLAIANADGSGRRNLTTAATANGLAWSPDATYIIGQVNGLLRIYRLGDMASVTLRFRDLNGVNEVLEQPDWR